MTNGHFICGVVWIFEAYYYQPSSVIAWNWALLPLSLSRIPVTLRDGQVHTNTWEHFLSPLRIKRQGGRTAMMHGRGRLLVHIGVTESDNDDAIEVAWIQNADNLRMSWGEGGGGPLDVSSANWTSLVDSLPCQAALNLDVVIVVEPEK